MYLSFLEYHAFLFRLESFFSERVCNFKQKLWSTCILSSIYCYRVKNLCIFNSNHLQASQKKWWQSANKYAYLWQINFELSLQININVFCSMATRISIKCTCTCEFSCADFSKYKTFWWSHVNLHMRQQGHEPLESGLKAPLKFFVNAQYAVCEISDILQNPSTRPQ